MRNASPTSMAGWVANYRRLSRPQANPLRGQHCELAFRSIVTSTSLSFVGNHQESMQGLSKPMRTKSRQVHARRHKHRQSICHPICIPLLQRSRFRCHPTRLELGRLPSTCRKSSCPIRGCVRDLPRDVRPSAHSRCMQPERNGMTQTHTQPGVRNSRVLTCYLRHQWQRFRSPSLAHSSPAKLWNSETCATGRVGNQKCANPA